MHTFAERAENRSVQRGDALPIFMQATDGCSNMVKVLAN
jgi:hypothetical protein